MFAGFDLSGVTAKGSQLKPGLRKVKITSAKEEDTYDKKGRQVAFEFASPNGVGDFRTWITISHSTNPEYAEWGWREIKAMLEALGYQGTTAPELTYFLNKELRISIIEEYLKKLDPEKPNIYSKRKIETYLPFDGPEKDYEPLPPPQLKQANVGGGAAPSGGGVHDDEIPF